MALRDGNERNAAVDLCVRQAVYQRFVFAYPAAADADAVHVAIGIEFHRSPVSARFDHSRQIVLKRKQITAVRGYVLEYAVFNGGCACGGFGLEQRHLGCDRYALALGADLEAHVLISAIGGFESDPLLEIGLESGAVHGQRILAR